MDDASVMIYPGIMEKPYRVKYMDESALMVSDEGGVNCSTHEAMRVKWHNLVDEFCDQMRYLHETRAEEIAKRTVVSRSVELRASEEVQIDGQRVSGIRIRDEHGNPATLTAGELRWAADQLESEYRDTEWILVKVPITDEAFTG